MGANQAGGSHHSKPLAGAETRTPLGAAETAGDAWSSGWRPRPMPRRRKQDMAVRSRPVPRSQERQARLLAGRAPLRCRWRARRRTTLALRTGPIPRSVRKFVDKLPQLGPTGANGLVTPGGDPAGQYLAIANPDKLTYPGSDYYEIELRQYTEKMHSDLPPTKLRGYVQVNNGTDSACGHTTREHRRRRRSIIWDRRSWRRRTGRSASSSPTTCPPARAATCSCRWTPPAWARAWGRTWSCP